MKAQTNTTTNMLYLTAIFFSIMLSLFAINTHGMINNDGICYVLSAEQFATNGLKQAMQWCGQANWPFYSVLLAFTAKLSAISFEQSALLLGVLFDAMTVLLFVMIIRLLNPSPRYVLLGLLTILAAHNFNSARDLIVRDHGFWMCYLASLYCLLRYVKGPNWFFAIAWAASILLASLFRIEGIVFFFLLPICVFSLPGGIYYRLKRLFQLYVPHVVLLSAAALLMVFFKDYLHDYSGRLPETLAKIAHSLSLISVQFHATKTNLLQHVLPHEAVRDATLVTVLLLIIWYLIAALSHFSWVYSGILMYCRKQIRIADRQAIWVLMTYLVVNLLITTTFFAMHFFLSRRYLMAQSLILMLFVPFCLNYLIEHANTLYRKGVLVVIIVWLLLVNSHLFYAGGDRHHYIMTAGQWVNSFVPASESLYTNDEFVLYYAKRHRDTFFQTMHQYQQLPATSLPTVDYMAINTKKPSAAQWLALINASPNAVLIRRFENKHHQQILIYHLTRGVT